MTHFVTSTRLSFLVFKCFIHSDLTHNSNFEQIITHNKIKYGNQFLLPGNNTPLFQYASIIMHHNILAVYS